MKKNEALPAACSDPASFNAHLDAVNDPYFVACLDIGHAEMRGLNTNAAQMVLALGDRLQALHIHDNDQWHDSHQIPFSMNIDFDAIVKALKKIDYKGYFTLEASAYLENPKFNADNVMKGTQDLADSARKLADMFEKGLIVMYKKALSPASVGDRAFSMPDIYRFRQSACFER